jgi:uncharacterized protein (DUF4415 family)
MNGSDVWVDPDDAPELGREWFDKAVLKVNGVPVKRGRGRPPGSDKEQVTLRIDAIVLAHFRADGPGWQTRVNDALRAAAGL